MALVRIGPGGEEEEVTVTEADVEALLAEAPERVDAAYELRKIEFDQPERVQARARQSEKKHPVDTW